MTDSILSQPYNGIRVFYTSPLSFCVNRKPFNNNANSVKKIHTSKLETCETPFKDRPLFATFSLQDFYPTSHQKSIFWLRFDRKNAGKGLKIYKYANENSIIIQKFLVSERSLLACDGWGRMLLIFCANPCTFSKIKGECVNYFLLFNHFTWFAMPNEFLPWPLTNRSSRCRKLKKILIRQLLNFSRVPNKRACMIFYLLVEKISNVKTAISWLF